MDHRGGSRSSCHLIVVVHIECHLHHSAAVLPFAGNTHIDDVIGQHWFASAISQCDRLGTVWSTLGASVIWLSKPSTDGVCYHAECVAFLSTDITICHATELLDHLYLSCSVPACATDYFLSIGVSRRSRVTGVYRPSVSKPWNFWMTAASHGALTVAILSP